MRTKNCEINKILIFITAVFLLFLTVPARLSAAGVDEDIEFVTDIQPITRSGKLKPPTVLDVKRSISEMEKDGVTIFTRVFNIDRSAGIQELFQKSRDIDKKVKEAGTNITTKKLMEVFATRKYRKIHRSKRLQGKYFEIVGPQRVKRIEKGKIIKKSFLPEMKELLDAADSAFEKTVGELRMAQFINWSKVPGRIYVVVEQDDWLRVGGMGVKSEIVQTVVSKPETREFYVYAGYKVSDFADQAIKYAVAKMVYQEYAKIISGKPDATLPMFFLDGAAAEAAGTESVITPAGPKQVSMVKLPGKTIRVKRPKKGIMLPLKKKYLYSLDEIIKITIPPSQTESKYYYLRQTKAMIQSLRDKAPLSYICLVRALASGKEFKKEIGLSYMEMQRDVEGREVKTLVKKKKTKKSSDWYSRNEKKEKQVEPKYRDYERFSKYLDTVFNKLTEEYIVEQWKKKKAEKAKKAKEARKAKAGKKEVDAKKLPSAVKQKK